jgi:2-oxoglutarate dehydrogenase E2 component (dihydrolipoamide succinyltransferase)
VGDASEVQLPEPEVLPWRRRGPRPKAGAAFRSPAVRRLLDAPDGARGDLVVPFSSIRRAIAGNLVRAKATAAHAFVGIEAHYTAVERVRARTGLHFLPFVGRAVIDALAEFPRLNGIVGEDHLVVSERVHLGIAVDLDFHGLVVPVIRDASGLSLVALGRAITDTARRAHARDLHPDDLAGGTFTITNPGPMGSDLSVPIINVPQVAVLATDTVRRRLVVVPDPNGEPGRDALAVRPVGRLGLSFDHRAVDGAYAAAFLARVAAILATRDWSAEI